jgi:hypothetical protein
MARSSKNSSWEASEMSREQVRSGQAGQHVTCLCGLLSLNFILHPDFGCLVACLIIVLVLQTSPGASVVNDIGVFREDRHDPPPIS